jgi:hypothetical protein
MADTENKTGSEPKKRLFEFTCQVQAESYDAAHMKMIDAVGGDPDVEVTDGHENYDSQKTATDKKLGIKKKESDLKSVEGP